MEIGSCPFCLLVIFSAVFLVKVVLPAITVHASSNLTPGKFSPQLKSWLWLKWYNFMASSYQHHYWTMMNYGYANLDGSRRVAVGQAGQWEQYSIQMYHYVATGGELEGGVDLSGADVVEVGCGRGGGCFWVQSLVNSKTQLGLDYSATQVEFCRKTHGCVGEVDLRSHPSPSSPALAFAEADASALPLRDEACDAVVNVESSHCYPDMEAFLREVLRVLRPGGYFLFADFRDKIEFEELEAQLGSSGLVRRYYRNVTPNVLAALDADHTRKVDDCLTLVPRLARPFVNMFIGTRDSKTYSNFRTGYWQYHYFVLQKPE